MSATNRTIPVAVNRTAAEPGPQPDAAPVTTPPLDAAPPGEPRVLYTPLIDIYEGTEGLILEADLPGATESGVSIQLEDNVLSLHARVTPATPEGARLVHEEFRLGDYYRSFILSDEVERSQIVAELRNGVLRLHLPKAERAKTRRIEIKS